MFPPDFLEKYRQILPQSDFNLFLDYCKKPLRKSIRINTLKISVKDFQKISHKNQWELTPIPWVKEGFWIERANKEIPLGNTPEHFLGLFYIQEASSMLPPAVLNPQPGEIVLDMAAAPGSKTTQLAAQMKNQGLIVANEPVVKRIKGLVSNLERLGTTAVVVSRKEGQFFGKSTSNFFDKILLDAPCTGEGTVRKDPQALQNWSQNRIKNMAKLQTELITAAFQALKPGGEMVYSTCTLGPEENEEVVTYLLKQFTGNAELIPLPYPKMQNKVIKFPKNNGMLRVWPQIYDSEGFFVAKIKKLKTTPKEISTQKKNFFRSKYKPLKHFEKEFLQNYLKERFDFTEKLTNKFKLLQKERQIYLCPLNLPEVDQKVYLERKGFHIGEFLNKRNGQMEFKINHLGILVCGKNFQKNILELKEENVLDYLTGKDLKLPVDSSSLQINDGVMALKYQNTVFAKGLLKGNRIKNQLPRYLIA